MGSHIDRDISYIVMRTVVHHLGAMGSRLTAPTLGSRIREAYVRAGMNRSKFVKLLDVSYVTVSDWEKDKHSPRTENLDAISSVTGFSVDELLGRETSDTIQDPIVYPSLRAFYKTPDGQTATNEEREQLNAMRFKHTPTELTFHFVLQGIRATLVEDPAEAAKITEDALGRALARGGRKLDD